jgi:hypothetical protein
MASECERRTLMQPGSRVRSVTTGKVGTVINYVDGTESASVRWDGQSDIVYVGVYFLEGISVESDESFQSAADAAADRIRGENPKDRIGATKPDLSLVPPAGLIAVAQAMKNGADKYGAYNWRGNAVQAMTYLAANMRHVLAYLDGEEVADDSGVEHLAHAAACLFILLDAKATGNLVDNRPAPGAAARLIKEGTCPSP